MSFYKICPHCGGHLDPGEKCDCQEQEEQERRKWESLVRCGGDGQYALNINYNGGFYERK